MSGSLKDYWYPKTSKLVLELKMLVDGPNREPAVIVHVARQHLHRLREPPWRDDIRRISQRFRVIIRPVAKESTPMP